MASGPQRRPERPVPKRSAGSATSFVKSDIGEPSKNIDEAWDHSGNSLRSSSRRSLLMLMTLNPSSRGVETSTAIPSSRCFSQPDIGLVPERGRPRDAVGSVGSSVPLLMIAVVDGRGRIRPRRGKVEVEIHRDEGFPSGRDGDIAVLQGDERPVVANADGLVGSAGLRRRSEKDGA